MCPPRHGFVPNPPHVSLWGMPVFVDGGRMPRTGHLAPALQAGGLVAQSHVNIPDGILPPNDPDRVLTRLMPGELVIPVKHVPYVSKMLKKKGIYLSGM